MSTWCQVRSWGYGREQNIRKIPYILVKETDNKQEYTICGIEMGTRRKYKSRRQRGVFRVVMTVQM